MSQYQEPSKVPLAESKVSTYWKIGLYFFSAGMMGKALAGFYDGVVGESIGNVGLSLIFAGMCFRSKEISILASFSNPVKRQKALEKLRKKERKEAPWVGWMVRIGWLSLAIGLVLELSNPI